MIHYTCPKCGRYSGTMELTEIKYGPTKKELKERPGFEWIQHEVLQCQCGNLNTWFDMVGQEYEISVSSFQPKLR